MSSDESREFESAVQRILNLPYRRDLVPAGANAWFAQLPDFPGCLVQAETAESALAELSGVMEAWVRARLESGATVPAPSGQTEYSGKFLARVGSSMHRALAERAEAEGVSLNHFVANALSYALGLTAQVGEHPNIVSTRSRRNVVAFDPAAFAPVGHVVPTWTKATIDDDPLVVGIGKVAGSRGGVSEKPGYVVFDVTLGDVKDYLDSHKPSGRKAET